MLKNTKSIKSDKPSLVFRVIISVLDLILVFLLILVGGLIVGNWFWMFYFIIVTPLVRFLYSIELIFSPLSSLIKGEFHWFVVYWYELLYITLVPITMIFIKLSNKIIDKGKALIIGVLVAYIILNSSNIFHITTIELNYFYSLHLYILALTLIEYCLNGSSIIKFLFFVKIVDKDTECHLTFGELFARNHIKSLEIFVWYLSIIFYLLKKETPCDYICNTKVVWKNSNENSICKD